MTPSALPWPWPCALGLCLGLAAGPPDAGTPHGARRPRVLITRAQAEGLALPEACPTSSVLRVVLPVTRGIALEGSFSITSKGHGLLELGGLAILLYDAHEDGVTFRGRLLRTEVLDVDGDGLNELVVSGLAECRDPERPSGRILRTVPVRAVFRYDPGTRRLKQVVSSPWIRVDGP